MTVCVISGCDATACYTVADPYGRLRRVCRKCRDELVAVYDYRLILDLVYP